MKVLVFGAGRVGTALVRILEENHHKVTIVDEDREVCDELAGESNSNIICGDAADPQLLDELKLDKVDYIFAVTGNEETNFLVAVYAKHVNAKKVISRASEIKYSSLMERLGVTPLVPEQTLARELGNMVLSPLISLMLDPSYSHIELLEKEVSTGLHSKTVEQVSEKNNFTIIAVYDNEEFLFPSLDFVLKKGMKIVFVKHNV